MKIERGHGNYLPWIGIVLTEEYNALKVKLGGALNQIIEKKYLIYFSKV
jgi:hypothetical protein